MNWSDLGKQVVSLGAPLLGTALGGPLGGAAGQVLAGAVGAGVTTPEAVNKALAGVSPDKLAEAEARWAEAMRAEADALRTAAAEAQQTIRAEIMADDPVQRWWRPLYAIELTLECAILWGVVFQKLWVADYQALNTITGATALLIAYWGFRFGVLGVYISGRTREKVCAATGQDTSGLFGNLMKTLTDTLAAKVPARKG